MWTGNEMFIGGGVGPRFGSLLKSGGRYKPATDSWSGMNSNAVPDFATTLEGVAVGAIPTAVWTGSEMIAWGLVVSNRQATSTGARYDPVDDLWSPITTVAAPEPRAGHTAVWTGKGMLMYGGMLRNSSLDPALYYYSRSKPVFLYKRP